MVALLVIVLPVLAFFVIPIALVSYDDGHQIVVECEVEGATVGATSSRS